jgi:superfamily I DNA/RNA helicase
MGERDYLFVLQALSEIPYGVGRKLLADFLNGNQSESIKRNRLSKFKSFGCLTYNENEIAELINRLLINNMIKQVSIQGNAFLKVLELTEKGRCELKSPALFRKKTAFAYKTESAAITEQDRIAFEALGNFLEKYNDSQKKAIISISRKILCVAGAGSGKTSVLTKRIEFLIKYRSVNPSKILAITFTRKARQEMMTRLMHENLHSDVRVETFNSFCESMLKEHNDLIYDRPVHVINYKDKILLIRQALEHVRTTMGQALDIYFTISQRRGKTDDQLANIFLNDIFFLRDYFKSKNLPLIREYFNVTPALERSFGLVLGVCRYVEEYMQSNGLRDYADQLLDALKLFKSHPGTIPRYDHIMVDEFQDVNSTQVELLDMLNPPNIFCVGDPRQSIFGWRGSDIRHILDFEEKYKGAEVITLTKNYRSSKHVVDLINSSIRSLGLPDLESASALEKDISLLNFESEMDEFEFVIQKIAESKLPRNEIFVLARTNRQLNELSQLMKLKDIKHVVKSDELRRTAAAVEGEVTLATIHAIKGMEAEQVFVLGCTNSNFPSKASEHPILEMVKLSEYDKEEEERRVFYVALSRAKNSIYLLYSGSTHTYFINESMLEKIGVQKKQAALKTSENIQNRAGNEILTKLKEWRREKATSLGIPAYMILHDKTLIDISVQLPMVNSDLDDINGLGPVKIAKYGQEILDIVVGK